ncbi:MAG: MbtH family NRPS accessory protein [Ktedonobacterales bacterium]|nr:MbtH family NRPS accessory protein [Ktedonobacterales bacterium]
MSEPETAIIYRAVVNQEDQYSLWPVDKVNALGWQDAGFSGPKADVLAYIAEHWTDMRPLSLRQAMDRAQTPLAVAATTSAPSAATPVTEPPVATPETVPGVAAAKGKRGWFGRQRQESVASTSAATETPKPKRGWFGRR